MDERVKISFDAEYRVRVLDSTKFNRAEELEKESSVFIESTSKFEYYTMYAFLETSVLLL